MEKVTLGDVATYINGYAFKPTDWKKEGIRIVRIQDLTGSINNPNFFQGIIDDKYLIKNGDILVAWSGSLGVYQWNGGRAYLNQHIFKVEFNKMDIDKRYFMYLMKSKIDTMYKNTHGSTMKHITKSNFYKIKISLHSKKEQLIIATRLDKMKKIIEFRKEQLNKLDELIKSQFVEMFGEPLISNNYGRVTLDKLTKVNQGLQIPISKRFVDSGENRYKYITIQYLNGGKQTEYIENPSARVICKKDDILMTRTGNTGQVITNVEGVFHNNFFKVDYDREKLNKEFLICFFEDEGVYRDMIRRATAATIPDLSHSEFYKMSIDLPPLALQNQFADFVQQVNKLKFEIEKSLEEMEELYESLMDKYFG